jgi:FkbM family methyltransferase
MTSIMANRVGRGGVVIGFEPQPDLYGELQGNVATWRRQGLGAAISVYQVALSNQHGTGYLSRPGFGWDRGGASITSQQPDSYQVQLRQLDDFVSGLGAVSVLKIDVEGHQLEVLQGSLESLRSQQIRDLVFEEQGQHPTPSTRVLQEFGYTIFKLDHNLLGPWIGPAASARRPVGDPSYLATTDPDRAMQRMRRRGWGVLRHRSV